MMSRRIGLSVATVTIFAGCSLAALGQFGGLPRGTDSDDIGADLQAHGRRLSRNPLGPVPADLVRPVGISAADQTIWDRLRATRTSFDFVHAPFADVIEFVRDLAGVNVFVDRAVSDERVTGELPVSVQIGDTRLDLALGRLLDTLKLTFIVKDGSVVVTSQSQASDELTVRVYPVADLVWEIGRDGMDAIDADSLVDLVRETISPDSWTSVGGPGEMYFFTANLSLALLQTSDGHDRVAGLLENVRRARDAQPKAAQDAEIDADVRAAVVAARQSPARTIVVGISEAEERIRQKLRETPATFDFVETPFSDIVEFLRTLTGQEIDVDRTRLNEEHVTGDTPVTFRIVNMPLDKVLNLMLGQHNLARIVRRDTLTITSQGNAADETVVRSYPVSDLVVARDGEDRWAVGDDELIELIEHLVHPNTWSNVGGLGTVRYFAPSHCLVVHQTQQAHERIADVLAMLREATSRLPAIGLAMRLPLTERLRVLRLKSEPR